MKKNTSTAPDKRSLIIGAILSKDKEKLELLAREKAGEVRIISSFYEDLKFHNCNWSGNKPTPVYVGEYRQVLLHIHYRRIHNVFLRRWLTTMVDKDKRTALKAVEGDEQD